MPRLQRGRITRVAERLDTNLVTVRRWLDHEDPIIPNTAMLLKIALTFHTSIDALFDIKNQNPSKAAVPDMDSMVGLPFMVLMNNQFSAIRTAYTPVETVWVEPMAKYAIFQSNTDAMHNVFGVDDYAIIGYEKKLKENRIYCLFHGCQVTFRRIHFDNGGKILFMADNVDFPQFSKEKEDIVMDWPQDGEELSKAGRAEGKLRILGRVVATLKHLK